MEEGIYQRQYIFNKEIRKRNAYVGLLEIERGLSLAIRLTKEEDSYNLDRPDRGAVIIKSPLEKLNRRILHKKGAITSSEFLEKIEDDLEKVSENPYEFSERLVRNMRAMHLLI